MGIGDRFLKWLGGGAGAASTSPASVAAQPAKKETLTVAACRQPESAHVYDIHGQARKLAALLNKGGEGRIYPLASLDSVLVKLYLPHVLQASRSDMIRRKLNTMLGDSDLRDSDAFGWPRALVFDAGQRWIGYAMRRVSGVSMQTLCQPHLIAERLSHWSRREVLRCAHSFVKLVGHAHARNVILGDINPGNFLIDPRTCEVRGIDCDSYQVSRDNTFFPCPVGIPMLMAPELLNGDFSAARRTVEQEAFSAAIMLFRMFMLGLHPYSRTYGEDPVANLKSGECALGLESGNKLPRGPWYNIWSHLPHYIKSLFIQTFREGNRNPARRVRLTEWDAALTRYTADMDKGWFDLHMVPQTPKSSQYNGSRTIGTPLSSRPASRENR